MQHQKERFIRFTNYFPMEIPNGCIETFPVSKLSTWKQVLSECCQHNFYGNGLQCTRACNHAHVGMITLTPLHPIHPVVDDGVCLTPCKPADVSDACINTPLLPTD